MFYNWEQQTILGFLNPTPAFKGAILMADYIRLQKVSQDADMTELQVSAGNAVISATSKIYITGSI